MLSAELPKKIGHYLVQDELNSTGRTRMFYALEEETGSEFVVKLLPVDFFSDPEFQNRFEVEMLALADLDVEEIVPVYHLGDEAGQPYLVLPYLSGGSLAERIMSGPLELDDIVKILLRISIALDAAHQAGIIHRNLKPSNILFDNHNQAYLSDFCQVKRSLDTGINISNAIDGAPTTMSPEQACGRLDMDYRSDIYSLGALVYEMLAGQPPFPGSNPVSQALQHVRNTPQDIRLLRPDLPEGCAAALEWAMHKDPNQRYRTAGEFALVFEQQAYFPQLYEKQRRAPGRRLLRKVALALLTLLLALFGAFFVLSWINYLPEPYRIHSYLNPTATLPLILPTQTATLAPTVIPTPTPLRPTPTSAPTRTPIPATLTPIPLPTSTPLARMPAGNLILGFADRIAVIARSNIWVADLDGSDLRQLTFDGGLKTDLQWTPDGQALVYKTQERSQPCYQILYLNGDQQTLGCYQDLEISPDMQQIAIGEKVTVEQTQGNESKLWLNFIAPFDLDLLSLIPDVPQTPIYGGCPFTGGTQLKFSTFDDTIAAIFSPDMGRGEYSVSVYRRRACGQDLDFLANLTPSRFRLRGPMGTSQRATIEDFGWDGGDLFALHGDYLHGYGEMIIYNRRTGLTRTVSPVQGQCCYQDIQWSPDGSYLLFVFQDASIGVGSQVYYIPYDLVNNMIQSNDLRNVKGSVLQPIAFPAGFFEDNKDERVEPALRQAIP